MAKVKFTKKRNRFKKMQEARHRRNGRRLIRMRRKRNGFKKSK